MAAASFEYRRGRRELVLLPLAAATDAIEIGDAITEESTAGYFQNVDGTGDTVIGIAAQKVASPSSDGLLSCLVDVSKESVYEVPPDTGTVAVTIVMNTCDVGADGRSVNIDASSVDGIEVIGVDTVANTAFVRIAPTYAGVV